MKHSLNCIAEFFVTRFCHDVFNRDYKATIGVDFEVERFSILSVAFNLQL